MSVFSFTSFLPDTHVIAHTWRGETFDLTGDLFSWQRTKPLSQSQAGTFTLNFTARKDSKGRTWADILMPMDYIEIRASKNGSRINGELPIILRGFVDDTSDSIAFGASGGPSEPRVAVVGRDYTKLLLEWQILYLWTQNTLKAGGNLAQIAGEAQGFGLYYNFQLPLMPESINAFFVAVMQKLVNPVIYGLRKEWIKVLPGFAHAFTFPDYPMSSLNVLSYTGSYMNLLQYFASPPFGELFIRDEEAGPTIVGRMTPYQTLAGVTPSPASAIPISGDLAHVISIDVERSDADLYTYFLTYGSSTQMVGLTTPVFATAAGNGVLTKWASLYGVRPLQLDTSWIAEYDPNNPKQPNTQALHIGSVLNEWAVNVLGENHYLWNGTAQVHGDEAYKIGTYWRDPEKKRVYYVSGIQDQFTLGNTGSGSNDWIGTLQLTRGRDEP